METITHKFENTPAGLKKKDECTRLLAAQGYRIVSEQLEQGHIKGQEQCCWALICLPGIFLAGRTPGNIIVTYARESVTPSHTYCMSCGAEVVSRATFCSKCGVEVRGQSTHDQSAANLAIKQKQVAADKTEEARESIRKLNSILADNLEWDHRFDWNSLIADYPVAKPVSPEAKPDPKAPRAEDFAPQLSLIERAIPSLRKKKYEAARDALRRAESNWKKAKEKNDFEKATTSNEYRQACSNWEEQKQRHEESQAAEMETRRRSYLAKDAGALKEYWKLVLERSADFTPFPSSHTFGYVPEDSTLIVDYDLPAIDSIPKVQEVRYAETSKTFEEVCHSDAWLHDFYSELIYRIVMKTVYVLLQSDAANAVEDIVVNGRVRTIDRATGHEIAPCILSVQTAKKAFLSMNLSQVEPRAWFKRCGGVATENLSDLHPVEPVRKTGNGFASSR